MFAERLCGLAPAFPEGVALAREAPVTFLQLRGLHHQGDAVSCEGRGGETCLPRVTPRGTAVATARDSPLHEGSGRLGKPHCLEIQSR